jgi:hypothetical protein
MTLVAIATQPRPTTRYKVDIIFQIECSKDHLLDQMCIYPMHA